MIVVETTDQYGGTIVEISGEPVTLQPKTAIPSTSSQVIGPDSSYTGLSEVLIEAIPSQFIIPTGTININNNGTVDVSQYASASVDVTSIISLQSKSVDPNESQQVVSADSGYDGLSQVTITAISSNYVGSNIANRSSTDLSASGSIVTAPAGYYATAATKNVSAGTAGTPTASKGSVNNHSISITPSVTNTTGYITGGTKSGTAVTVSASELVSGTKSIAANGTNIDVTNYAFASVNVPTGTARTSTDLIADGSTITAPAGLYSVAASKSVSAGTAATPATTISVTPSISVNTSTGVITATASGSQFVTPTISAGYVSAGTSGKITVSGSNTSNLTTQAAATITPTKSSQTAVAANRYTTGAVTVAAIPAAYQDVTSVTATASDVLSGKTIVNSSGTTVNGSLVIQHYYTGSGTPAAASGSNGDIYLQTS